MTKKVEEIVAKIQEMVGDGDKVSGFDSFKNNRSGKDVGFSIYKNGKDFGPVMYLSVREIAEGNVDELAERVVHDLEDSEVDESAVSSIDAMSKDYILQNVVYRLIGQKTNEKLLTECPYKPFCDMALVYYVKISESRDNYMSFRVRNEHVDGFRITPEELDEAAVRNTTAEGISFHSVTDMNRDMMLLRIAGRIEEAEALIRGPRIPAKYDVAIEDADICGGRMYSLTNHRQLNGAAMVALPGVLKLIADQADGDLVVFPGSIHEVNICRYTPQISRANCNRTVREANRHTVKPDEILSDHAYRYRRDLGMLTVL
ncbi:MAG: DUF5688 family protein [Lachnospiraceae bacterium]|nr:DUF5688 family protein [Lachnospiraceae bacterium]